ncbi:hypothetical protein ACHWQZ_G007008 [Mnemiopsis leidyi]
MWQWQYFLVIIGLQILFWNIETNLAGITRNCRIVEVRSYLKEQCDVNGTSYYKCTNSDTLYQVPWEQCDFQEHTAICENDPGFYQVCGHVTCPQYQYQRDGPMLCGSFMCQYYLEYTWHLNDSSGEWWQKKDPKYVNQGGNEMTYFFQCNGKESCKNTDVDERYCEEEMFVCNNEEYVNKTNKCDGECRCYLCQDEIGCNKDYDNFGMYCYNTFHLRIGFNVWYTPYVPPSVICDGYVDCRDGSDEVDCIGTDTCISTENLGSKNLTLIERNRCSIPNELYLVCQNYRDQLNCSHVLDSPLLCKVNGYMTTVSRYALCKDTSLCDNELDKKCDAAEGGCIIHKHQFCDGHRDCPEGKDEENSICETLTNQTCKRKFSFERPGKDLQVPLTWVGDGVEDCLNGKDEDHDSWKVCGEGWSSRFQDPDSVCSDVFLCSNITKDFEEYEHLCDRSGSCEKEARICEISRNLPKIYSDATRHMGRVFIGHYLPGLENLIKGDFALGNHSAKPFTSPDKPFGVAPQPMTIAISPANHSLCSHVYGELYVYLSCNGFCPETSCILRRSVKFDSCHNIKENRVFTLSDNNYLTIALRKKGNYVSNLFPCNNGYCVTYDKICNLADDCGDGSDEVECINHFTCKTSGHMIPLSSVHNSHYDCEDFSDECSSAKPIIKSPVLSIVSWIIGISATFLNVIVFIKSLTKINEFECPFKLVNRCMILLISFGDLLVGIYLIVLSIVNVLLKDTYCRERFKWLTSGYCAAMGVVSSTGSQISLFAMVVLSLCRVITIRRFRPSTMGKKLSRLISIALTLLVLLPSFAIAYVPLLDMLEDFFVNGLYYDKSIRLFVGAPSKQEHIAILEEYYSKFRGDPNLPWSTVRRLVRNMFSQTYGGVNSVKLHFYGNDGVCLFKYFVTPEDPQAFYSLMILILNFICFVVITSSYILINLESISSRRALRLAKRKTNSSLHRKLTMIILTDFFCWVPFIVVSGLHYFMIVDASHWYATFSIFILPINSVINPVLYDSYLKTLFCTLRISSTRLLRLTSDQNTTSEITINRNRPGMGRVKSSSTTFWRIAAENTATQQVQPSSLSGNKKWCDKEVSHL